MIDVRGEAHVLDALDRRLAALPAGVHGRGVPGCVRSHLQLGLVGGRAQRVGGLGGSHGRQAV